VDPVVEADPEVSGKDAGMASRHPISQFMMRLAIASSAV